MLVHKQQTNLYSHCNKGSDSTVDAPVINLENHKDGPTLSPPTSAACLPSGESEVSLPPGGEMTSSMEGRIKDTTNTASVSPYSGTMWLGTEDGWYVYLVNLL